MNLFFHEFVETSLESIPVLRVMHTECHNGRDFRLTQTVYRNVYTEFDSKLSRHLSATRGDGFPAFTAKVEIIDARSNGKVNHLASAFHNSVPHALKELAGRAVERVGPVELTFQQSISNDEGRPPVCHKRMISTADIQMLGTGLGICRALGDVEFLDISGDFDIIVATPPGMLNPVFLHLRNGTVSVPSTAIGEAPPFQWPVYAFAEHASSNHSVQGYLASVGRSLMVEKEAAILAFRAAAERLVVNFQSALDGRPLEGHWLKGAQGLVARLKVGLGDTLTGISVDAQGIALDLSAAIAIHEGTDAASTPGPRFRVPQAP